MVQIGSGFKKAKEIHIRQQKQGSADRPTNHNPSAVVGPNGSKSGSNREDEFQPSTMSKIAGEFQPNQIHSEILYITIFTKIKIADDLMFPSNDC